MPFRSLSQERYLFAKKPELAQEYAAKTPAGTVLPDKVQLPNKVQAPTVPPIKLKRPRYGVK